MSSILIIGGGPAGYVAALRAATLGAEVTLIESDTLGGTCLNRGCIPTKALYAAAKTIHNLKNSSAFGIHIPSYSLDCQKLQEHKNNTIRSLVSGIEKLIKARKINLIRGKASFDQTFRQTKTVRLDTAQGIQSVTADYILIATGSQPSSPLIRGVELPNIVDSTQLLNFETIPASLAVIGGGVVGMEFAGIFGLLGSKVSVIEKFQILNTVDSDIVKRYSAMAKSKIDIYPETDIESIRQVHNDQGSASLQINCVNKKSSFTVQADVVLLSAGRIGNFKDLALENTDIDFDTKKILVNENYETSVKNIYAIGDVNGKCLLAHAASHQAVQVVEKILLGKEVLPTVIPSCIFVFPEIACVGITEEDAKQKGIEYQKTRIMFGSNGKALSMNEAEGFVKIISEKDSQKLLGVHILGPHASDLVAEAGLAIQNGLGVEAIKNTVHAHPTLSEAFHEGVLSLAGAPLHSL